ncbi:MAG TPA: TonB-dependent receptor plug domain-containing protein [Rhodothermales bacterium]|nr:TonB-dependent receptor plug domain-containing protein [Rhodothermales bacterium]
MKGHAFARRTCLLLGTVLCLSVNLDCTSSKLATSKNSDAVTQGHGSTLTAEEIARSPGTNIWDLLAARVPGVVNQGGHISIRGVHSIMGSNDPLYVLDGMEVTSQPILNRNDVEYIKVLKGSDTSFYGVRGANGVIVIKTKIRN